MQIEAARELGVSGETLHNWETGRRAPQKCLRERIVGFLGYDPREEGVPFPEQPRRAPSHRGSQRAGRPRQASGRAAQGKQAV